MIVFDDMIADMESNKKISPIITELFIKGRKLNISLVSISQYYFKLPKTIRLNAAHHFIIKFLTKENFNKYHQIIRLTLILKIS